MEVKSFKLIKSKNIFLELLYFIIIVLGLLILGVLINIRYKTFKEEKNNIKITLNYCSRIYDKNNINYIDINQIDECLEKLNNIKQSDFKISIINKINQIKKYVLLKEKINNLYVDKQIKISLTLDDISYLYNETQKLDSEYQSYLLPIIKEMEIQYTKVGLLNFFINSMYETSDKNKLRTDLTRVEYEQSLIAYNDISQDEIKEQYLKYLNEADEYLTELERIQEEIIRQEKIKNAWIKLNVPYVSQNLNNVYNGCEAASILMALQYKGYLKEMDLFTFSANMPKSDDPNTGFYLDIFGKEPINIAHWIAPAPLTKYAIEASGNYNVVDATGYELSSLSNEIVNGNPVVIYLTYDFIEPYNWANGVPKNLHVLLLTGYNTITEQFIITDPYTRWNGNYEFILSKEDIEYLYNIVGKRAVVVR